MNLRDLIKTRRTVGAYSTRKVDDALVEEALALSLWAPNHRLTYPWAYTWLGPAARTKLGELGAAMKGGLDSVKGKMVLAGVTGCSHLISLGVRRNEREVITHEDYATLSCSVQILSMFLWDHGVSTKWSTAGWAMGDEAYGIIGVDPKEVRLEGALMIGYDANGQPPAPERPPLSRFLRRTE